ncbi:MAG: flagellar FliJ family protein [Bryobacteraceae bacterium]|nr:flagellar FliJ family protein [Bryobacteraceae bacterium]
MKRFFFPLERVLAFRRTELDSAQRALDLTAARRAELLRELADNGRKRDASYAANGSVVELRAREDFDRFLAKVRLRLREQVTAVEKELDRRRTQLIEAKRKCELLEKLRSRRWSEWTAEMERELEELAADAFRARLAAGNRSQSGRRMVG